MPSDIARVGSSILLLHEAGAAIESLRSINVPVVVLKGAALIDFVYAVDERPMTDVDLLVLPGDFERAHVHLVERGYCWLACRERSGVLRRFHERVYCSPRSVLIDLHANLDEPRRWRIEVEELFVRAVPTTVNGRETLRLSNEDMLLHLAVHLAKDELGVSTASVADAARIINRIGVDWQVVVERARKWGCRTACWLALRQAQLVAGAVVPASVVADLQPGRVRRGFLEGLLDLSRVPAFKWPVWKRFRQLALRPTILDSWTQRLGDAYGVIALRLPSPGAKSGSVDDV